MKCPSQFELQLWRKAYKAIFTNQKLVNHLFEARTKHPLDSVSAEFSHEDSNYKASAGLLWYAPNADEFRVSIVPTDVNNGNIPIWSFYVKYLEEYPNTYEKYLSLIKLLQI